MYQTFASKRQNAVLHSAKDLSLYENTEYDIYYLWKQDRPLALAIVRYSIEECVVLDIVGESAECEKRLLDCIFLASNRRLVYPLLQTKPADTQSRSPYMLKPLSDKANCSPTPLYFNLLLDKQAIELRITEIVPVITEWYYWIALILLCITAF